jgi:hypothetical protein
MVRDEEVEMVYTKYVEPHLGGVSNKCTKTAKGGSAPYTYDGRSFYRN